MPLNLEIVTAERVVFADVVDVVIAPGAEGELGILPRHAPLFSLLQAGELRIRKGGTETSLAITGGFLEVHANKVTVLADAAERADEIDVTRAEAAMQRARQSVIDGRRAAPEDMRVAAAALRRSAVRLKVARRRRGDAPMPR